MGRVGGSELVVAVTVNDEQVVGPLMRRIQHTLDEPIVVDGKPIRLHSSLGVAIAEDTESAEEVLARADRSSARRQALSRPEVHAGPVARGPAAR